MPEAAPPPPAPTTDRDRIEADRAKLARGLELMHARFANAFRRLAQ